MCKKVFTVIAVFAAAVLLPAVISCGQTDSNEPNKTNKADNFSEVTLGTISNPILGAVRSEDNRHLAMVTSKGTKIQVFLDGKADPEYDGIMNGALFFSPDGNHTAYVVRKGIRWLIVADGKQGSEYDSVSKETVTFSPDSKRLAYIARKAGKWIVVIDGKASPDYNGVVTGSFFSPDSKHTMYAIQKADKWQAIIDGNVVRILSHQ